MVTPLDDETTISRIKEAAARGGFSDDRDVAGNPAPASKKVLRNNTADQQAAGNAAPPIRPLALTDAQLTAIMSAAEPLEAHDRTLFLEDVAAALQGLVEIGDGLVHRVASEMQRRYWRAPDLSRSKDVSKWR